MKKEIKKIVEEFFIKMLFFELEIKVEKIDELYEVMVESDEPALLIGKNGETLSAIEQILRLIVSKKIGGPINLSLDIAGYKNKRKLEIEKMAIMAADRAVRTKRLELLIPMNGYERRVVHLALAEREDIETESIGEEPNRRVMIKIKKKELLRQ